MTDLRDSRVLVTGADGFIGSHLVDRLLEEGADVRAFCFYNSNGSLGWLEELDWQVRSELDIRLGDIRDPGFVRDAIEGVDIVFHLAALIAIPHSYTSPASFVETNITGTLNVIEAVRRTNVQCMVHTSTSEVYGTPETVPITEDHPLRGQSPYSATKIGADKLVESYALSFGTPARILRPFNTYGPRQSTRAVIPTILSQLLAGTEKVKLGSMSPERDFTFVSDTVEGFIQMAATDLPPGSTVQLGTGTSVSVADLVDLCMQITGVQAEVITEGQRVRPDASEVQVLVSDPSRARRMLGWEPRVSLADGLRSVAEWLAMREPDARRVALYHR